MKNHAVILIGLTLLSGCDQAKTPSPSASPTSLADMMMAEAPAPAPPAAAVPGTRGWQSEDGQIAFAYPASLSPSKAFPATYFTPEGWRVTFDGSSAGPGRGLVRFSEEIGIAGDASRVATEILQIGRSRDPGVIADCLTHGLEGGNGMKQPDRTIGGVRFTVYRNGDAGMSHQLSTTNMRALHDGQCIAIDLLTSSVPASVGDSAIGGRGSEEVERDFEAVLESLEFE